MLDPTLLRKNLDTVITELASRGFIFDRLTFEALESRRKALQTETEILQARRNTLAKLIGQCIAHGNDASTSMVESQAIPARLKRLEEKLGTLQADLNVFLQGLPNLPHASVPIGSSEKNNLEVRRWVQGTTDPKANPLPLGFKPRDHLALGEPLGLDLELAARLSGSRFSFMHGPVARLHRALAQFMLDVQANEHGYTECYTPYIVNASTLVGTGQLPKFVDQMFTVSKGGDDNVAVCREDQYLISTAEITLTSIVRDKIVATTDLPICLTAHTPCFRSEAGSGGRDIRGMIRQHQFDKVEIVQITHPEKSYDALEAMVGHAETILQRLGLSYRLMLLCTAELGFCAAKTYDLEVWLPAQNTWREISSVSNSEAFQARRMQARYRTSENKTKLLHTLNGSGLAVGRALVAVLENYQQADGSIKVPKVLQPYLGGLEMLQAG